jgi:hypothetical protein
VAELYGLDRSGAEAKHSNIVIYVDGSYVQELRDDETEARLVVAKNRARKVGAIEARFYVMPLGFESTSPKPQPEQADWFNR